MIALKSHWSSPQLACSAARAVHQQQQQQQQLVASHPRRSPASSTMAPALLKLMVLASALVAAEMGSREPSDSAERCLSEDEVEDSEERLVSIMQTELLQKEVRRFKASDKFPMRTDAVGEDEATLVAGELAEQELLAQLIRKEESLASISKDIQSNKVAVHEIMSSPHKQLSAQAQAPSSGPVDCEKYPMFCDPKVNCSQNPLTEDDRKAIGKQLATADGHVNYRTWCLAYPMYATSVQNCIVEGDVKGYAQSMFEAQKKLKLLDADAIYCFSAGHCNKTEVTDSTSLASTTEAECDSRYGHKQWTSVGWTDFTAVLARALDVGKTHQIPKEWKVTGWSSLVKLARHEADISAMTACAMGNYLCDLSYCHANYCQNPQYRERFGNLSWVYPDVWESSQ